MSQPTPPPFTPAHPVDTISAPSGQPLPPTPGTADSDDTYQNNPFTLALEGISSLFTYAKSIAIALLAVGLLTALGNAVSTILDPSTSGETETVSSTDTLDMSETLTFLLIMFAVSAILFIVAMVFKGAGDVAAAAAANREKLLFGQVFSRLFARLPGYILLQLLIFVKVLAWSLLFIVPGVIMSVRYSLAGTAYFARNMSADQALRHSITLTKGGWITTLASLGLFNIVTLGTLPLLVQSGVQSALFRQFDAYAQKNLQKPGPHGLSIAYFVLCLLLIVLTIVVVGLIASIAARSLGA